MNELIKKDLKYLWHPYTQMKDCETSPPVEIVKAEGIKLFGIDGSEYYDTISSWWCNVHGHNHPKINAAIRDQLNSLDHVLFAGFTHKPAVELGEKLVKITPDELKRVFFSDNGSTAVEVAMKMSFQYWLNKGVTGKEKFLSLDMGYHGDTVGAMSVSGVDLFNSKFSPMFFDSFKAPTPYCYRCPCDRSRSDCSLECLGLMEDILKEHAPLIAGIILEPILMGAGGMIIYPAEYLKGVRSLADKYQVHLILDEVAAGFGRTGKMFAAEHAKIAPDLMCLSKGVTSGYLPLGITMATEDIFDAFYDDYENLKTFYHGHTFTANPISCAAANVAIDLFREEGTLENVGMINQMLSSFLEVVSSFPMVGEVRSIGAVGAIELVKNRSTKEPFGLKERIGFEIYKRGLKEGVLLRPLGNIIYFFLPLCASREELEDIFSRSAIVINDIVK